MRNPQLRLVNDPPARAPAQHDPVRLVFEHWMLMNGKSAARCKLDPHRKGVITSMLTLYEPDVLLQAIEGMAAESLEGKPSTMQAAMRELEWLLLRAARIEHWADKGLALRDACEAAHARQLRAPAVASAPEADPAEQAAARERMRCYVAECRAPQHG